MAQATENGSPPRGPLAARLSTAQIALLWQHGEERATTGGEVLFREGDRSYDFLVILPGMLVTVDGYRGTQRVLGVGLLETSLPSSTCSRASGCTPPW